MSELGEIKQGKEIGKRDRNKHIYAACVDCGKDSYAMEKKKKEVSVEKLEEKFDSLEGKFDNFITNHFAHLVKDVSILVEQNGVMQQNMVTMKKDILRTFINHRGEEKSNVTYRD